MDIYYDDLMHQPWTTENLELHRRETLGFITTVRLYLDFLEDPTMNLAVPKDVLKALDRIEAEVTRSLAPSSIPSQVQEPPE